MYRRKAFDTQSVSVLQRLSRLCNGSACGLSFDVHNAVALEAQMRKHSPELYASITKTSAPQYFYPRHAASKCVKDKALLYSLPLPQYLIDSDENVKDLQRRTFYHSSSLRTADGLEAERSDAPYIPRCGRTGLFYTREEVVDNLQAAAADLAFRSPFWLTADHPGLRSGYLALREGSEAICVSLTASVVSITDVDRIDVALLHPTLRRVTSSDRVVATLDVPHAPGMNAISGFTSHNPYILRMPHHGVWLSLDQLLRYNLRLAPHAKDREAVAAPTLVEVARWELYNADQLCSPGRLAVQLEPASTTDNARTVPQKLFHLIYNSASFQTFADFALAMQRNEEGDVADVYARAMHLLTAATIAPDPDAPSCDAFRLRPSEEAALAVRRYLQPPKPWGLKISLARTHLGPSRCVELGRALVLNRTVTYLDISACDMQPEAAIVFFECLRRNTTLRHLNVSGNRVGDVGAIAAAQSCVHKLQSLHIASNDISDDGAAAIAQALRTSTTLKTLNIRNNNLTLHGMLTLIDALEDVSGILPSSLLAFMTASRSDQSLPPGDAEGVEEKMYNTELHTLWLENNAEELPSEARKALDAILTKRYPQPPKELQKAGKRGRRSKKAEKTM